jgi:hypothetical protein
VAILSPRPALTKGYYPAPRSSSVESQRGPAVPSPRLSHTLSVRDGRFQLFGVRIPLSSWGLCRRPRALEARIKPRNRRGPDKPGHDPAEMAGWLNMTGSRGREGAGLPRSWKAPLRRLPKLAPYRLDIGKRRQAGLIAEILDLMRGGRPCEP